MKLYISGLIADIKDNSNTSVEKPYKRGRVWLKADNMSDFKKLDLIVCL